MPNIQQALSRRGEVPVPGLWMKPSSVVTSYMHPPKIQVTHLGLEINWFKASAFKFYDCLELLIVFSLGKKCVEEAGPTGPLGRSHCPCPSCRVGPTTPGSPEWDSGAIPPPLEEACIGHLLLGRPSWTQLLQKTD